MKKYSIRKVDWDTIIKLSDNIVEQIKRDNLKIDTFVPIIRGGFPMALLLSNKFDNIDISCIHIRRSNSNCTNAEFSDAVYKGVTNEKALEGKNILIVEDIIDEGETLDLALKKLKEYNPKNIYIATIFNFNTGKYKDAISGEYLKEKEWILFPWEVEND